METTLTLDAIEQHRSWLIESGRSTETARAYSSDLKMLLQWSGQPEIKAADLDRIASAWTTAERDVKLARTINRRMSSVKAFSKWADMGEVLHNYQRPRPSRALPHPLPRLMDDVEAMIQQCTVHTEVTLIALCAFQGCRISEARDVMPFDIDLAEMNLHISGKGDKDRVIPLASRTWEMIFPTYRWALDNNLPLVPFTDSTARNKIRVLGRKAGVGRAVSSHDLRATFGTVMYNKTLDLRLVQELMGHSNSATTEVYTNVTMNSMREAVEL